MAYCPVCEDDFDGSRCPECNTELEDRPSDYGRSIGQLVGKIQERRLVELLEEEGFYPSQGVRLETPVEDGDGNKMTQETDLLVGTKSDPALGIESKYLSRTKQAREKVYQMVCMANMVQERYEDMCNYAVLTGNFSDGAINVAEWGLDRVYYLPMPQMKQNLAQVDIAVEWDNDDPNRDQILKETWENYYSLMAKNEDKLLDIIFEGSSIESDLKEAINEDVDSYHYQSGLDDH